jgi:iron complex outermembrane receptor protein
MGCWQPRRHHAVQKGITHAPPQPLASAIALAIAGLAVPAFAAEPADRLDTVVVVGTHRSDVTALQSAAPVDVLSGEKLQETGASDLSAALTALSPSFQFRSRPRAPLLVPSPKAPRCAAWPRTRCWCWSTASAATPANVTRQGLVNARGAAAVDLSLIPLSAIERVEILRDGAAAYGSDAIAGVINIVLKERDEGGNAGYASAATRKATVCSANSAAGRALPCPTTVS